MPALVLALLGKDETVVDILKNAYASADHEMKLHILEALGHIGYCENFEFFINTYDEPYQILRIANASSLIQCLNR